MEGDSEKTGKRDELMKLKKECRNGITAFVKEAEFLSTTGGPEGGLSYKYTSASVKGVN